MRKLHITNDSGKNTLVSFATARTLRPPQLGYQGEPAAFVRYLAGAESGTHEALVERFGEDYGDELVRADPEVDMEVIGRRLGESRRIYIEYEWKEVDGREIKVGSGKIRHAPPLVTELLINPDGSERERRAPKDVAANINDELPIYWTGKKLSREDAVRRFVFVRTVQIFHQDGLTYDYLFGIASELSKEGVMVLIGGGAKGKEPLVFQTNGSPFRGFLEGRVEGETYKLLLHLSNMELKTPA